MAGNRKHGFRSGIRNRSRAQVDHHKTLIRNAVRPFDGDGSAFKTALRELRQEGYKITRNRTMCHYINEGKEQTL